MDTLDILFISSIIAFLFMLSTDIRVFLKVGWSIKAYKLYWLTSEGKSGIIVSHIKLFTVMMVIPTVLMFVNGAFASDSGWLKGGYFVGGIQYSGEPSVFCQQRGIGGNSNSNFTVAQKMYTWSSPKAKVSIGGYASHHSCDISPDAKGYDKFGPMFLIEW